METISITALNETGECETREYEVDLDNPVHVMLYLTSDKHSLISNMLFLKCLKTFNKKPVEERLNTLGDFVDLYLHALLRNAGESESRALCKAFDDAFNSIEERLSKAA